MVNGDFIDELEIERRRIQDNPPLCNDCGFKEYWHDEGVESKIQGKRVCGKFEVKKNNG